MGKWKSNFQLLSNGFWLSGSSWHFDVFKSLQMLCKNWTQANCSPCPRECRGPGISMARKPALARRKCVDITWAAAVTKSQMTTFRCWWRLSEGKYSTLDYTTHLQDFAVFSCSKQNPCCERSKKAMILVFILLYFNSNFIIRGIFKIIKFKIYHSYS